MFIFPEYDTSLFSPYISFTSASLPFLQSFFLYSFTLFFFDCSCSCRLSDAQRIHLNLRAWGSTFGSAEGDIVACSQPGSRVWKWRLYFMCQSNSSYPIISLKLPRCCREPRTSSTDCSSVCSLRGNNCFALHITPLDWQVSEVCNNTAGRTHTLSGSWIHYRYYRYMEDKQLCYSLCRQWRLHCSITNSKRLWNAGVWQHFIESEFLPNHWTWLFQNH